MMTALIVLSITCLVLAVFSLVSCAVAIIQFQGSKDNEAEYMRQLRVDTKLLKLSAEQTFKYKNLWKLHKKKSTDLRIQLHALSKKPATQRKTAKKS
tara:strand:- start:159284 stop:159574 length:291 start_codon:yes stop_codon:yes gene_type:complete